MARGFLVAGAHYAALRKRVKSDLPGMDFLHFFLGALAVHRLSLLVSKEKGPFFIFRKLREAPPKKGSLDDGLKCFLCCSVWFSKPVTAFYWWQGLIEPAWTPVYWLAFSSAAILLHMPTTSKV